MKLFFLKSKFVHVSDHHNYLNPQAWIQIAFYSVVGLTCSHDDVAEILLTWLKQQSFIYLAIAFLNG